MIERQFFMLIWEAAGEDGQRELLRRAKELAGCFANCEIDTEICDQSAIIRLYNLFSNPNYAHLEEGDMLPTIPLLVRREIEA